MPEPLSLDGPLPPEMARKAEDIGVRKGNLPFVPLFLLSVLAGAYIALGAAFYTTVITGSAGVMPFGLMKLVGGLAFSLGLILVVVGGAELFTGNNLLVMAWVSGKLGAGSLLRNWAIVYFGNFVGSVATAYLIFLTGPYTQADGAMGLTMLNVAAAKCDLDWAKAFFSGIYCNALVCLAVWLTYSGRTTTDKILAIVFPITAFVACGFEHCVANMYFIPAGLFIRQLAPPDYWLAAGAQPLDYPALTWVNFLEVNLVPVTLGNIVGGAVFVAGVYWVIYCRRTA